MFAQMKNRSASRSGSAESARWRRLNAADKFAQLELEKRSPSRLWPLYAVTASHGLFAVALVSSDAAAWQGLGHILFGLFLLVLFGLGTIPAQRRDRWRRMQADLDRQIALEARTVLFECELEGVTYWVSATDPFQAATLLRAEWSGTSGEDTEGDASYLSVEEVTEALARKRRFLGDESPPGSMWDEFQRDRSPRVIASSDY